MKTIKIRPIALTLAVAVFALIGCETSQNKSVTNAMENTIVVLKFKAQEEQGERAVSEITKLLEKVKSEPNFVGIKLHVNPTDNTNILLYEEWEDVDYYNTKHMDTDHIKAFMTNSRNFLAGPPEITFWKVKRDFR